jgi:hypothetical protein
MRTDYKLTPEKIEIWAELPTWDIGESASLCCGYNPGDMPIRHSGSTKYELPVETEEYLAYRAKVQRAYSIIERATIAKDLPSISRQQDDTRISFRPKELVTWAIEIGLFPDLPEQFIELFLPTKAPISGDLLLRNNTYWLELEKKAVNAIELFPAWRNDQRHIRKEANLKEWIIKVTSANAREQDIIKKVLSDAFPELNKNS